MATIPSANYWQNQFSPAEQQELLHDDAEAFGRVTGILLCVVTAGVLLALISVVFILGATLPGLF